MIGGVVIGMAAGVYISSGLKHSLTSIQSIVSKDQTDAWQEAPRELQELAESFQAISQQARTDRQQLTLAEERDLITGFLNHRAFQEYLSKTLQEVSDRNGSLSLILVDLDHFHEINAGYGYGIGEETLRKVTETIRSAVGEVACIGRYGADTFAIALVDIEPSAAYEIAERIRLNISWFPYVLTVKEVPGGRVELPLSACVGVACYPEHAQDHSSLAKAAEITLLMAKQGGKNRVVTYDTLSETRGDLDVSGLNRLISDPSIAAIETLAGAVDARDPYTHGHSERVALYSVAIATELGLNPEERELLRTAALLHDVGKIGIPDSVLKKPAALDKDDWEIIKDHPQLGANILGKAPQLSPILPGILYHHERYDGKGYPHGLAGHQIPRIARILAVADTLDAITSNRPYRPGRPLEDALEEIERCSGTQFEPEVIDACRRAFIGKRRKRPMT
jgi:diguanylate cyclase (GGDEF)-like protein/putative nucleotidyltransferase with HDIG domain